MKPYYEQDGIVIFHGDCREVLPAIAFQGAIVTDPPYGLGDKMQGGTWGAASKYADLRRWDVAPDRLFFEDLNRLSDECVIWGGNYFELPPARCWLVWDKKNAVPTMADCEFAWTSIDKPAKRISLPVGVHKFGHPTEKPLPLMEWTLQHIKADTIVDPFSGSGTTLLAAKNSGRKAIGIEIEEKYCEIAANRLAQGVLFGAAV